MNSYTVLANDLDELIKRAIKNNSVTDDIIQAAKLYRDKMREWGERQSESGRTQGTDRKAINRQGD